MVLRAFNGLTKVSFKQFGFLCLVIAFVQPLGKPASATQSYVDSNEVALMFCAYVRDNEVNRLQSKLRELRLRMRDIYSNIRCNNHSLIQFALIHDSIDVGTYLAKSVTTEDILDAGDYVFAREQGKLDTLIGATLMERITQ